MPSRSASSLSGYPRGFIIDPERASGNHGEALRRGVMFFAILAAMILVILCA